LLLLLIISDNPPLLLLPTYLPSYLYNVSTSFLLLLVRHLLLEAMHLFLIASCSILSTGSIINLFDVRFASKKCFEADRPLRGSPD